MEQTLLIHEPTYNNRTGASTKTLINIGLGMFLSLLVAVSILGNILVCAAIWTDKNLRKLSNLLFISLAVADLLLSSLVMPFAIVNDLSGEWMFGKDYCNLWISTDVMCCTASIISLLAISLERYIHIKDPLQYTEWLTRKTIPISIVVIWVTSALISFLPISLGLHAPLSSPNIKKLKSHNLSTTNISGGGSKSLHFSEVQNEAVDVPEKPQCQLDFSPIYSITSSVVSFFLPCILMLIIYFHLFAIAKHHMKEMKAQTRPLVRLRLLQEAQQKHHEGQNGTIDAAAMAAGNPEMNGRNKANKKTNTIVTLSDSPLIQEHKAAITIGIIMGVFLLCWMPFFIINVVAGFCKDCISVTSFKILTWLGYSNSAFNPIIYTIFNSEFRHAFQRILSQLWRKTCNIFKFSRNCQQNHHENRGVSSLEQEVLRNTNNFYQRR